MGVFAGNRCDWFWRIFLVGKFLMLLNAVDSTKTGFTRFDFFCRLWCRMLLGLAWSDSGRCGTSTLGQFRFSSHGIRKKDLRIETMPDIVTCDVSG